MVGLVLPINPTTGMPVAFTFLARNASEIQYNMDKKAKSSLVYVVLAQALVPKAPPFILQIFGTDNKFKARDVLIRWQHTEQELRRYLKFINGWNIQILMIAYFQTRYRSGRIFV